VDERAQVFYLNRRPGLPSGLTMPMVAGEHAEALQAAFGGPVDVLGVSTGGSIAQQVAADHPQVVRRLVLISTGCLLSRRRGWRSVELPRVSVAEHGVRLSP
jgi:pimeloyl-ACP methyl ester carboxylesterase